MSGSSPLYAAIDLGSNSFHLLIVRNVAGAVSAVCRIKRKVRLASGLDSENEITKKARQQKNGAAKRKFRECASDVFSAFGARVSRKKPRDAAVPLR